MKLNKRLLSLLLVVVMVIGMFPLSAAAEDEGQTLCEVCQSAEHLTADHPAEDVPEVCGICNSAEHTTAAHPVTNSLDDEPEDLCPNCDNADCTGCDGTDGQNDDEVTDPVCTGNPATCQVTDCTCKEPKTEEPLCDKCNATKTAEGAIKHETTCEKVQPDALCGQCNAVRLEDGTISHEETCPTLKKDDRTTPTDATTQPTTQPTEGTTAPTEAPLCEKCDATLAEDGKTVVHADGCELKPLCDKCGTLEKNEDGTPKHAEKCETLCSCTPVDGVHQPYCVLYEEVFEPTSEVTAEDGNTVKVEGIPEDAALQLGEPDASALDEIMGVVGAQYGGATKFKLRRSAAPKRIVPEIRELFSYDISVLNTDGSEWQPEDGPVEVTLTVPGLSVGAFETVYVGHMHDGEVNILETKVDYLNETITFTTEGFSVFYGFIVDFEYNGYKFSLDGGSEVKLSELMESLGISRGVSSVADVVFSDMSLIEIKQEDGDWVLKSLKSFATTEWLDIYFNDGTLIEIRVTDPVLFYYLDGTNWCLETFRDTINPHTGHTAPDGVLTINKAAITGKALGATHENKDDGTVVYDVLIYARPGMAIRFDRYSSMSTVDFSNKPARWVWGNDNSGDDDTGYNYVILNDSSSVQEFTFAASIGDHGNSGTDYVSCEIKIVIVPYKTSPQLLSDALKSSPFKDKYVIKTLDVNVYDYDGQNFNDLYAGDHFSFKGYSEGKSATASGYTGKGEQNGGAYGNGATMGIMANTLNADGLPVPVAGTYVDLFSENDLYLNGKMAKKVYKDVKWEFVYEPATGYYNYSSNLNHAQLEGDTMRLYHGAMGTTASYALNGQSENYAYGGFYPFVDINKAVNGGGQFLDWATWDARIENGYTKAFVPYASDLIYSSASTSNPGTNNAYYTNVNPKVNNHNGIMVDANFYMPADGLTDNDKEIIYQFTGDDDLWVYIDGKLALDIGGGHHPISGEINFTKGTVHVGLADNGGTGHSVNGKDHNGEYNGTISVQRDAVHNVKIFYLERYAGVSNCRMRFNIPFIPQGAVLVSKELMNDDTKTDEFAVQTEEDYDFTVYTYTPATGEDQDDIVNGTNYIPYANAKYTIFGTDTTGKTDINGKFTLKAGQTAVFEGIERFTEVYVVEAKPNDGFIYGTPQVSVGDENKVDYTYGEASSALVMPLDGSLKFSFTNYMEVMDMTVTKNLTDVSNREPEDKTYEMTVSLDGKVYNGKATLNGVETDVVEGKVNLGHDDVLVIENIPTNMTYSVVETTPVAPAGYRYETPKYSNATGTKVTSLANVALTEETNDVVVYNELIAVLGHLTITKDGISALDHHNQLSNFMKEEKQSTVYHIYGTSSSGVEVDMEVVLVGNDSITIMDLPVGTYTVTEKESWSWRYKAVDAEQSAIITGGNYTTVEFENDRTNCFWLSGDNIAQNIFDGIVNN